MLRRTFTRALGATLAASAAAGGAKAQHDHGQPGHDHAAMAARDPIAMPPPPTNKFQIGMIIFDGMTNSDFVGPNDVFARVGAAKVHTLAKTRNPVTTDANGRVLADMTLAEAPELDLLFVGGGPGSTALMDDPEVLDFLRTRAPRAKWITSVCTGALVLGAAGLLRGYKAATHWAAMEVLPTLGAIPVAERVVIDRNRITGGGVTAGIDFGLTVVAKLWGQQTAEMIQLGQEYNPQPPFNSGSPKTASPELVTHFRGMWAKQTEARMAAAKRASARFG
jgi:cyclohexyl-isocyanide hydratase